MIIKAVEQELTKKGFRKAGAGEKPDFLVAYFALISVNTSGQTLGQFLPGSVAWGLPPFEQVATSLKIYEQGSLVLDVMSPDQASRCGAAWRGPRSTAIARTPSAASAFATRSATWWPSSRRRRSEVRGQNHV